MNERIGNSKIYSLAKEAGLIEFEQFAWNPELGSPTYESVAKARKFAELIVRECARLAIEKQTENDVLNIVSKNPAKDFAYALVKHFGVEE